MEATQDTHTRTGRPEVAVNLFSAFFRYWTVLPRGPPRSSGQLVSARGPSDALGWAGKCSVLLHVCTVGVLSGGNPFLTRGEHANSTQKGPGDSPPEHC